jgi:DNA-binding NarL/FixJ family response regulator
MVISDDHDIFVDSLRTVLIGEGFAVAAVALTVAQTLKAVRDHRPDVCLIDRHFADGDGVDVVDDLLDASPHTAVVVLTADPDPDAMLKALQAGARGYVHKTRGIAALVVAIRRATAGDVVVDLPPARSRNRSDGIRGHANRA